MPNVHESYEAHTSKIDADGSLRSAEVVYIVTDAANEDAALAAVHEHAAASYRGVPLSYIEISSRDNATTYHVSAVYEFTSSNGGGSGGSDDDAPTMSFECSAGTEHITRSLKQRHWGSRDAGGLIGWNGKSGADMQVAGVDVPVAQMRLAFTRTMHYSEVIDTKFMRKVNSIFRCVNRDTWKGWNPGEVLFLGGSFITPLKHTSKVQVTFNFAVQLNEKKTIKVAGEEKTVEKGGWEYIWVIPKTEIGNGGTLVSEIDDLYCEVIFEAKDFSILGL